MKDEHVQALSEVAAEMYQNAKDHGFHDGDVRGAEPIGNWCANLHAEVSELWEAHRNHKLLSPCDKLETGLTCAEEEFADIVIRVMDSAVSLGIDIGKAIQAKAAYNRTRSHRHGGKAA